MSTWHLICFLVGLALSLSPSVSEIVNQSFPFNMPSNLPSIPQPGTVGDALSGFSFPSPPALNEVLVNPTTGNSTPSVTVNSIPTADRSIEEASGLTKLDVKASEDVKVIEDSKKEDLKVKTDLINKNLEDLEVEKAKKAKEQAEATRVLKKGPKGTMRPELGNDIFVGDDYYDVLLNFDFSAVPLGLSGEGEGEREGEGEEEVELRITLPADYTSYVSYLFYSSFEATGDWTFEENILSIRLAKNTLAAGPIELLMNINVDGASFQGATAPYTLAADSEYGVEGVVLLADLHLNNAVEVMLVGEGVDPITEVRVGATRRKLEQVVNKLMGFSVDVSVDVGEDKDKQAVVEEKGEEKGFIEKTQLFLEETVESVGDSVKAAAESVKSLFTGDEKENKTTDLTQREDGVLKTTTCLITKVQYAHRVGTPFDDSIVTYTCYVGEEGRDHSASAQERVLEVFNSEGEETPHNDHVQSVIDSIFPSGKVGSYAKMVGVFGRCLVKYNTLDTVPDAILHSAKGEVKDEVKEIEKETEKETEETDATEVEVTGTEDETISESEGEGEKMVDESGESETDYGASDLQAEFEDDHFIRPESRRQAYAIDPASGTVVLVDSGTGLLCGDSSGCPMCFGRKECDVNEQCHSGICNVAVNECVGGEPNSAGEWLHRGVGVTVFVLAIASMMV